VPGRLRPSTLKDRFTGNKGVNALPSLRMGYQQSQSASVRLSSRRSLADWAMENPNPGLNLMTMEQHHDSSKPPQFFILIA